MDKIRKVGVLCLDLSNLMLLQSWEAILICLHLANYQKIVCDVNAPTFGKIKNTHWAVDYFVEVSKHIFNLEQNITVDECKIPYKGRHGYIEEFLPHSSIKLGIKIWALARF